MKIKFKAKNYEGEWVYGLPYSGNIDQIVDGEEHIDIIPKTLSVFLGLYDSKKQEVYSNDYLDFDEKEWGCTFVPEKVRLKDIIGEWSLSGSKSDLKVFRKVIGNKFD